MGKKVIILFITLSFLVAMFDMPGDNMTSAEPSDGTIFDPSFTIHSLPSYAEYSAEHPSILNVTINEYHSKYGTSGQYGSDYKIRIDDAAQLFLFSTLTNDLTTRTHYLGLDYILGNNIDYAGYFQNTSNYFMPIGRGSMNDSGDIPFTGTFDGQGFEIVNLRLSVDISTVNINRLFAFFGSNQGVIRNFGLVNPIINTSSVVGDVYTSGIAGKNLPGGLIEFVYVEDNRTTGAGYQGENALFSGLVSLNQSNAKISNAYYSGIVADTAYYAAGNIRPAIFINYGSLEEVYYNKSKYLTQSIPLRQVVVAGSSRTYVTLSAADAASYSVGQKISIGKLPYVDDIAVDKEITSITVNGANRNVNFSGAVSTVIGNYVWNSDVDFDPNPNGSGTVTGVNTTSLETRKNCLQAENWRTNAYESVHANAQGLLRSTPKLQGFSGYAASGWGSATSPFKILTPADLIYFAQFFSTKDSVITSKTYNVGACIDMSTVAPDAYFFTQFPETSKSFEFSGTSDGTEPCRGHHHKTIEGITPSHSIINLSMTKAVNGSVQSAAKILYNNADVIAFIPTTAYGTGAIIKNLNFIGGIVKPPVNPSANILLMGTISGFGLIPLDNTHSSMNVIVPDGETTPFYAGGITGYSSVTSTNVSFSGIISGGIHPYNAAKAPAKDYSVGGIYGALHTSSEHTNILSDGLVESPGFYNVPLTAGKYASNDIATLSAGVIGGTLIPSQARTLVNKSDVYTVPMNYSGTEPSPRTGPLGERVYALSPSAGGIFAYGPHPDEVTPTMRNRLVNYGNIYGINMNGRSSVAGILGTHYRTSHGWKIENAANYGNVTVSDSDGSVLVSGIQNRMTNGVTSSFISIYNYGNVEVKSNNRLSTCLVAGISSMTPTVIDSKSSVPIAASNNVYNYGKINVSITSPACDLYVGGITAINDTINAGIMYSNIQNHGDISVNTSQTSGELKVCGIAQTSIENSANMGNITVNSTGSMSTPIHVGGITYLAPTAKSFTNVVNAGKINVTANTSDYVEVGGFFPSVNAVTSVNKCLNIADIYVKNSGTAYVGGIGGYLQGGAATFEIIDSINCGNITSEAGGNSLATAVGGIIGYANNRFRIQNCINYGDVSSTITNTGAIKQYTGGIFGHLVPAPAITERLTIAVNGHINFGNVTANAPAANTDIATGGIAGYYKANAYLVLTNLINNGTVTQSNGSNLGSIIGNVELPTGTLSATDLAFANHLSTVSGINMYGSSTSLNSAASLGKLMLKNLVTVNPSDKNIGGASTHTAPLQSIVSYKSNDTDGIYAEDFVFNTDPLNNCFVYNSVANLATPRKANFPDGMYALTTNADFSSKIYLPETMHIDYIDGLSIDPAQHSEGVKDAAWRTDDRKDFDGSAMPDSSVNDRYDFVKQVDNQPVIMTMTLQSDAIGKDPINTFDYIQRRDDVNNILYFFTTENLLGREYYISSWTANSGKVCSTPNGGSLEGIKLVVPSHYAPGDDPRSIDVENKVYLINPADSSFVPVEYTVKLQFIPDPKMTLATLTQSTQAGLTPSKTFYAADLEKDGETYIVPEQVYYSGTHSTPILSFKLSTENLSAGFQQNNYATFTRDATGEDYTGKFLFATDAHFFASTFIEKSNPPQYLSGYSKTGPATDNTGNTNIYTASNDISLPEGWYTFNLTVNNRVLLSIRFLRNQNNFGFPHPSTFYDIYMENRTVVRNNAPFGLSTYPGYFYPFGSSQRGTDVILYPTVGDRGSAICTEGERLLTDIKQNPDGTHTYINKVAYIPETGIQDKTWWTVTTNEGLTGSLALSGVRLNDIRQGDGDGFVVNTSHETMDNVVKFEGVYSVIDFSGDNNIKFGVKYTSGGTTTDLEQDGSSSDYSPRFDLNGRSILSIDQRKTGQSNLSHNTLLATTPSGLCDYTVILSKDAPSGSYEIYFIYDREQTVKLSTFNESTKAFVKDSYSRVINWKYNFPTPLTINKALGSDSYLKSANMSGSMYESMECITPGHSHQQVIAMNDGRINYASTVMSGVGRDNNLRLNLYFPVGFDVAGKSINLQTALGAKIYRKINDMWIQVNPQHMVDYVIGGEYEYKIVSENNENTTYYLISPKGLPRNKMLNIEASEGDGISNLQEFYENNSDELFITLKQVGSDDYGVSQTYEMYNASFIENNGVHLPHDFPLVSSGTYIIDAEVPPGYVFEFYKGTGTDVKQTLTDSHIPGIKFTIDNIETKQLVNLSLKISKVTEAPPLPWGMYSVWYSRDVIPKPLVAVNEFDVVFNTSGELFTDIRPEAHTNVIISPRQIHSSKAPGTCFTQGSVTVSDGVTITGDIFAKKDVHIYGTVIGDIHAEGEVYFYGSGSVSGSY